MPTDYAHTGSELGPSAEAMRLLIVATGSDWKEKIQALELSGLRVRGVRSEQDIPEVLAAWPADIVILDSALAALVPQIKRVRPCVCVLVVPGYSAHSLSLALECGADTLLASPVSPQAVQRICAQEREAPKQRRAASISPVLPNSLIGKNARMLEVWRMVMLASPSNASVLITGETGVGKEIVARALHRFSPRRTGPFIAVNCAAIPETLLESELFGHEKGAFTGAAQRHTGRFEMAHGGTLFLDEIGELPPAVQVKLLRVLQDRAFERVGGQERLEVDVRIITATNRCLDEEVAKGRFRSDLFYRLNVIAIEVPPLRERKADVVPLWNHFIAVSAGHEHRVPPPSSLALQRALVQHDWPGNIRELENASRHTMTVVTSGGEAAIEPSDLPRYLFDRGAPPTAQLDLSGLSLKELERMAILATYQATGSKKETAKVLGISVRKLHYRLKQYRVEDPESASEGESALPPSAEVVRPARKRVLLAEDNDDVRWALTEVIEGEGFEVIAVASGTALLEHLGAAMLLEQRDAPPDLIVTDIRMPGISGMRVLESVRARGWTTPVVVISSFGDEEICRRALEAGATAFLHKPIDIRELQRVLTEATARPVA